MSDGHPDSRRWYRSLRPSSGRSDWLPGLFYPLIVAALVGLVTVLVGVREDVAVLKERVRHLEQRSGTKAELPQSSGSVFAWWGP